MHSPKMMGFFIDFFRFLLVSAVHPDLVLLPGHGVWAGTRLGGVWTEKAELNAVIVTSRCSCVQYLYFQCSIFLCSLVHPQLFRSPRYGAVGDSAFAAEGCIFQVWKRSGHPSWRGRNCA